MGTLTGNTPLLPDHCRHKLPTSCRLTATALCCACQDKRPHSPSYSVYVDGVGLVMRGTRWQRYCYFCKEFWQNRVAATHPPIEPSQTRVPEVPDQSPFLDRWFDFHRGWRYERTEEGSEHRVDVICEKSWRDVDPGTLPVWNFDDRPLIATTSPAATAPLPNISLEETLEDLLAAASLDEQGPIDRQEPSEGRIERDSEILTVVHLTGEQTGASQRQSQHLTWQRDSQEAANRLEQANADLTRAASRREEAALELDAAERVLRNCQVERGMALRNRRDAGRLLRIHNSQEANERVARRFARVFGTREEIERQGPEYESPLTTMFSRAYERYRVAEEVRAEERTSDENAERFQHFLQNMTWSFPSAAQEQLDNPEELDIPEELLDIPEEHIDTYDQSKTLDDVNRPPPATDAEMTIKLACKICLQQKADTAVLPCGHLVMCAFCADICVPTAPHDQSRPVGKPPCPLCRKIVKKRVRIYHS